MKKHVEITLLVFVGLAALGAAIYFYATATVQPIAAGTESDPRNIPYILNNQSYSLVNGMAEKEIVSGDVVKDVLRVFGEPVYGDVDGDGDLDAALLLQSQPGGSGTFYYAVLAIRTSNGFASTNALLLGDRIAPQTVEIREGRAVYNYADRKADEPVSVPPSVGVSLWISYDSETGEIRALER